MTKGIESVDDLRHARSYRGDLEGLKASKNRAFDLSTPKLPFASNGGGRIVSASRSPPGQAPKRLDSWSCFSQSSFLTIGCTLGALWAFDNQTRFGPPEVSQEAPPWKSPHFLGLIWESFFA